MIRAIALVLLGGVLAFGLLTSVGGAALQAGPVARLEQTRGSVERHLTHGHTLPGQLGPTPGGHRAP